MRAGVDIGGTFTDLVLSDGGSLKIHKLLSSPDRPERSMLGGLETMTPGGLAALRQVAHGSTVATNAILERKGARAALLTTAGFRDLLFIGRQDRPLLYDIHPSIPPPLIPRERCYEIRERLDFQGEILTPLDEAALDQALDQVEADQVDAIAVCLLFSYVNPAHEQRVKARILERGILSDRLAGGAFVRGAAGIPRVRAGQHHSLGSLCTAGHVALRRGAGSGAGERDITAHHEVRRRSDAGEPGATGAIHTALSGPAAGVMGAFHLAKMAGFDKIITLDMGGTSTDVALIAGTSRAAPGIGD